MDPGFHFVCGAPVNWLKITGASEMHTRGVKVFMINGQGRWRLHAQEPGDMVYKYWQSSLLEKIATSNF